jgi:P450-derived glycosyltransferase activator
MLAADDLLRRLQLVHGLRWLHAAGGDPYAALLRGVDDDPYQLYDRIRERGPLWRSALGVWVTAHHEVAAELLDHPATVDGSPTSLPLDDEFEWLANAGAATLPAIEQYRELADSIGKQVLDELGPDFDLVSALSRIAVDVLAARFGLREAARLALHDHCAAAAAAWDGMVCPQRLDTALAARGAVAELHALLAGRDPTGPLLAVFGVRAATDLTANAVLASLTDPGRWRRLAADPRLATLVVGETRRHCPTTHLQTLIVRSDVDIAGQRIEAENRVAVVVGGANRDPAVYPEPDRFRPDRTAPRLLPIASGADRVAQAFAEALAEQLLRLLAVELPGLRRMGPPLHRDRAPVSHGLLRVPMARR